LSGKRRCTGQRGNGRATVRRRAHRGRREQPASLEVERGADLHNPRVHDRDGTQEVRAGPQSPSPDRPLVQRVVDVETQLHRACAPEIHPLRGTDVQLMGVGEVKAAAGLDVQHVRRNGFTPSKEHLPSLGNPAPDIVVRRRQNAVRQVVRAGHLRLPLPGVIGRVKGLVGIRGAPNGIVNCIIGDAEPCASGVATNRGVQPRDRVRRAELPPLGRPFRERDFEGLEIVIRGGAVGEHVVWFARPPKLEGYS